MTTAIQITQNTTLADIQSLGNVTSLGPGLDIVDNPSLPTCQAEELRDALVSQGWTGEATISGNDDSGTCE